MTLRQLIHSIDDNILLFTGVFLLAFIPLYPKWPLFDILNGYNVRVRLEDFLVLTGCIIWLIYVLRGKIVLKDIPVFKPVVIYLGIGFLSILSAIVVMHSVTLDAYQIGKLFLHWFRRIEYFSLFFICYSAIRTKKQLGWYLGATIITIIGITIYGYGQKYLLWPAYSTMNREFSKGIVLYLTEHARVMSTFGGHYDLAAYAMLTLTLLVVIALLTKRWLLATVVVVLALAEYWLLILTASRTSFIGLLGALTISFGILLWKLKWHWVISRYVAVISIIMAIMLTLGPLSERFSQIIKVKDITDKLNFIARLSQKPVVAPPSNGYAYREDMSPEDQLKQVASQSDEPPSPNKPGGQSGIEPMPQPTPEDVYGQPYKDFQATDAASLNKDKPVIHVDYSENALKYGLSTGIRLDVLWPRAINAFKSNPLFGTGYATLVKEHAWDQTPAESTDNDYLRMLGETGLLGALSFMAILASCIYLFITAFNLTSRPWEYGVLAVGVGMVVGILCNALYIDIFESSKVAYTFWSFMGILVGLSGIIIKEHKGKSADIYTVIRNYWSTHLKSK